MGAFSERRKIYPAACIVIRWTDFVVFDDAQQVPYLYLIIEKLIVQG